MADGTGLGEVRINRGIYVIGRVGDCGGQADIA